MLFRNSATCKTAKFLKEAQTDCMHAIKLNHFKVLFRLYPSKTVLNVADDRLGVKLSVHNTLINKLSSSGPGPGQ